MKKILIAGLILSITTLFIGCGNSIVKKSIEQAITAIDNKEYDKALLSLEMALDEDKENEEATKLYKIVGSYQDANSAMEDKNLEEAKKALDSINDDYVNYSIKDDIDELKKEIENHYKEIDEINNHLEEAEKMFNDKKYGDCKIYLLSNILGSEGENIEPNKYATDEQNQKALDLVGKCELSIAEEERLAEEARLAEEERLAEEARLAEEENRKKEEASKKEKVYSKSEINNILGSLNKGSLYSDSSEDEYINGELCYMGNIVWNNGNRTRMFFVGSKTLTIYNSMGEAKGSIYENQNFDLEF